MASRAAGRDGGCRCLIRGPPAGRTGTATWPNCSGHRPSTAASRSTSSRARLARRSRSACLSCAHSPGTGAGPAPRTSESATRAAAAAPTHVACPAPALHLLGEHPQFGRVEPVAVQQVAAVPALDPVAAEHGTQPAHQHGQLIIRPRGRGVPPERVDEHSRRHRLPLRQGQQLQRLPRLPAAERLRLDPVHAEVAEHPHSQRLHAGIKPLPSGGRQPATANWLQPPPAMLAWKVTQP